MIVLALDTTSRAGSVAVVRNREILGEQVGDASLTHGQRLPDELRRALRNLSLRPEDLDLLAVAAGPGSFTGIRVGIAAMQGLAVALARRIVPVSALDALAHACARHGSGEPIGVWMDAQRGEVFSALYESEGQQIVIEPSVARPEVTLLAWSSRTRGSPRFIGDGAVRYADAIRAQLGAATRIDAPPPLAGIIGLIAAASSAGAVLPHAVVPIYIRRPDAELARSDRQREADS